MTAPKITRRQREILDHLSLRGAISQEKASWVFGGDAKVADTLAAQGVINKRYDAQHGAVYWIRPEGEPATGSNILAGFMVLLKKDVKTPSGRSENFFLARARYDERGPTFRRLLRGWLATLDLANKDLLGGTWGFELLPPDSPVFGGDHVILDETKAVP